MCSLRIGFPFSGQAEHSRRHEKRQQCSECFKCFAERRDLRRHVEAMHEPQWVHCPRCGTKLKKRKDNLQRHAMKHCKRRQHHLGD
ncbi:hypothetical protein F5B20DRAFT_264363 [Whalleya microplaca]|nr:hypothetical protein F5B20DRAFT_264363 [Whalleya microplaca]